MLSGCNLLKKTASETLTGEHVIKSADELNLTAKHSLKSSKHFLEWRTDSLNKKDVVLIWPKGKFTFSTLNGFEGEAESIVMSSALNHSGSDLKMKDSLLSEKTHLKAGQLHKNENKSQSKSITKTQTPAFWPMIAVVFILMTGLIIYKLLKKRI